MKHNMSCLEKQLLPNINIFTECLPCTDNTEVTAFQKLTEGKGLGVGKVQGAMDTQRLDRQG